MYVFKNFILNYFSQLLFLIYIDSSMTLGIQIEFHSDQKVGYVPNDL